jgi:hypothetical protein
LSKVEDKAVSERESAPDRLSSDGETAPMKCWLTRAEFASLDESTRALYLSIGDEYRLKPPDRPEPEVTDTRQQKIALVVLFTLAMTFAAIGVYGYKIDSLQLQILGFCGSMPTFLGFLIHLSMAMNSFDKPL